jgi:LPXTG-motif cell wall-anchored protein
VISKFGGITVTKTASDKADDDPDYYQVGAEFEVWLDVNHNGLLDEGTDTKVLGPLATDADGQVTFDGLRYSDWWDGAQHAPLGGIAIARPTDKWTDPGTGGSASDQDVWASYNSYLLVETEAVDGYELLAEPYPFVVEDLASTHGVDIEDNPIDLGFKLPFTGGTGSTIVGIAGLVLLVGAAGVSVVVLRRRSLTPHR